MEILNKSYRLQVTGYKFILSCNMQHVTCNSEYGTLNSKHETRNPELKTLN